MKITFKQLEKLINSGEVNLIYLSSSSLWFTHDISDVKESTKLGKRVQKKLLKEYLNDKGVPKKSKDLVKSLVKKSKDDIVFLDPDGNNLIINTNPKQWIKNVKKNPLHFGKYGLDAFILTHARNCDGVVFNNWKEVQRALNKIT